MKKKIILLAALSAIVVLAMCSVSLAATHQKTTNLPVTVSVSSVCNLSGVGSLAFGPYDPTQSGPLYTNGSITLNCTKGTVYWLYITGTQSMTGTTYADSLTFNLYSDSGYSIAFPVTNTGGGTTSTTSAAHYVTVYGKIPAVQDVSVDSYSQTLLATVTY